MEVGHSQEVGIDVDNEEWRIDDRWEAVEVAVCIVWEYV